MPASSATTVSQALQRASAVLVLLQRLCVWGASQRATPSNILHTQSNILCTPSKILCTPSKILCAPSNILCTLSDILHKSYLWFSEHPIGTALAPRHGELWSWISLPCDNLRGTQNTQVLWALWRMSATDDGWVLLHDCSRVNTLMSATVWSSDFSRVNASAWVLWQCATCTLHHGME